MTRSSCRWFESFGLARAATHCRLLGLVVLLSIRYAVHGTAEHKYKVTLARPLIATYPHGLLTGHQQRDGHASKHAWTPHTTVPILIAFVAKNLNIRIVGAELERKTVHQRLLDPV
jgi:hypothetical protein